MIPARLSPSAVLRRQPIPALAAEFTLPSLVLPTAWWGCCKSTPTAAPPKCRALLTITEQARPCFRWRLTHSGGSNVCDRSVETVLCSFTGGVDGSQPESGVLINRFSDNVGGVKHFRAHFSMRSEKSAISLSWVVCAFQPGSPLSVSTNAIC